MDNTDLIKLRLKCDNLKANIEKANRLLDKVKQDVFNVVSVLTDKVVNSNTRIIKLSEFTDNRRMKIKHNYIIPGLQGRLFTIFVFDTLEGVDEEFIEYIFSDLIDIFGKDILDRYLYVVAPDTILDDIDAIYKKRSDEKFI